MSVEHYPTCGASRGEGVACLTADRCLCPCHKVAVEPDMPTDEQFAAALDWVCDVLAASGDVYAIDALMPRLQDIDELAVFMTLTMSCSALFGTVVGNHRDHDCELAPPMALATMRHNVEQTIHAALSLHDAGLLTPTEGTPE